MTKEVFEFIMLHVKLYKYSCQFLLQLLSNALRIQNETHSRSKYAPFSSTLQLFNNQKIMNSEANNDLKLC